MYDGMKLVAALRILLRIGRRLRDCHLEEDAPGNKPANLRPTATDLLGWHPHIQRDPEPRQPARLL